MPLQTYAIVSAYRDGEIIAQVGGTEIGDDDSLSIFFPKAHGYRFPEDSRPETALPSIDTRKVYLPNEKEKENKLGVWITRAEERPHTTVMAFLSSTRDAPFFGHSGAIRAQESLGVAVLHRSEG